MTNRPTLNKSALATLFAVLTALTLSFVPISDTYAQVPPEKSNDPFAAVAAATPQNATLKVGDSAPPLRVGEWVKGKPITALTPGKVYIVDFFASWCTPCYQTVPMLSEIGRQYRGRVEIIGVSVLEKGADIPKQVRNFVNRLGRQMDYAVGRDDGEGNMAKTWLAAGGQNTLPNTFIVDGNGRIVYIGHPQFRQFEETLAGLLAGSVTADTARAAESQKVGQQERDNNAQARIANAVKLLREDKKAEGFAALEKAAIDFPDSRGKIAGTHFLWLMRDDATLAKKYAEKYGETAKLPADAPALSQIAVMLTSHSVFEGAFDFPLAIKLLQKANDLKPNDPYLLDTLAGIVFQNGDAKQALTLQEKAIASLAKSELRGNREFADLLAQHLAQYKAKAGAR
jgi:thiol-disulfide isomerase/thioredoxin